MNQIYTTTLRINLNHEDDRRAFEYLQRMDKKQYRSYSKAIVAAINEYFGSQERLAADPYLETREKEDAFLQRVMEAIAKGIQTAPTGFGAMLPLLQTASSPTVPEQEDEGLSAALDFADSF